MTDQMHDIVQVNPEQGDFGGCFVVVTEVKPWGVQGYVQSAGVEGQAYIRLSDGEYENTGGSAIWVAP